MVIRELIGKKELKEEEPLPDTHEGTEADKINPDKNIDEFIKSMEEKDPALKTEPLISTSKKKRLLKEQQQAPALPPTQQQPVALPPVQQTETPPVQPEQKPAEQEQEPVAKKEEELESTFTQSLNIFLSKDNKDKVPEAQKALDEALEDQFIIAVQAGIKVTKENIEDVKKTLEYFSNNGYLVVITGEKTERVLNEDKS